MKVIKRISCMLLSVMILFFGVNNSYFSPVKIDQVEAAGTVVLGYETMQAICYYFGSLVLGYSSVAEVPDLTEEQIEKIGHAYIKSLFSVNGVPETVADKLATANQALFTLISNKQAYVFGSEALKEVAETDFQVIMGGNNGDEEPSPSPDEKKKLNIGKAIGCIGALSVFGATVFEESLKFYIDKFSKGEDNFLDIELDELPVIYPEDVAKMIDLAEPYDYKASFKIQGYFAHPYSNGYNLYQQYDILQTISDRISASYSLAFNSSNELSLQINFYANKGTSSWQTYEITMIFTELHDGKVFSQKTDNRSLISQWQSANDKYLQNMMVSYVSNIPMFGSAEDARYYVQTGQGIEKAFNYSKKYKIADWLQDNWDGELFDPLTGLSYLNDLANMAKHQGLNALGNDPSLDDMKQHLRDIIANLKPGYDPVTDPSVDPALDPICYPDTIPTPVIDPTADVVLQPAKDPTPSPNPDPSPSTSPKPTTQPTPSPGEIDSAQPVVDLSKFFPFCIPFDLIHLIQVLDADPVAPKWTLKLEPPQFPVEWEVVLDLSNFESLAKIFRTGETLLFVVGLILITRGIIKG